MNLVVVSAGHSPASGTSRLGRLVARTVSECGGAAVAADHVELRGFAGEVAQALVTGTLTAPVQRAVEAVGGADGVVLLTPTVNASFSGLLKSFLDVLPRDALRGVPVLVGATGGTTRHTLVVDQSLRPMLASLRAVVLPTALFVTADQWQGQQPGAELLARVVSAAEELVRFQAVARQPVFS
ncbi:oxidoreductase [Actinomyces sp. 2119]|uniref:Oxidoreductase n=1 Tax=Actinomyces lilanjuaniae TaxID=2321394 RepID=A0ABM6Z1I6_9ACTO|nr:MULTISPECIES: NAD(P)H-dependent oxidoreductase [Actinomyces]AYD88995.1 oxidoreductase [Actinomyces lilanjuaniae]RJF41153.1 oxidoreductase [Actinomyces sp. 2119]